jgi:N-acylneuraminate cytidylyltransferase
MELNNSEDGFSFVLPLRAGSQRVINKNTKDFAGIKGGLTYLKIKELLKIKEMNRCYITSDDSGVLEIANSFNDPRIVAIMRPIELCQSTTKVEDLTAYIRELVDDQHIFWVHATAPFVTHDVLIKAWEEYRDKVIANKSHDSLMSVTKIQQFIWSKEDNRVINNSCANSRWPQTQDLVPLYEINHAFYINSKVNYSDRIGINPFCFELNKFESVDIDWPEDFIFAEELWKSKY